MNVITVNVGQGALTVVRHNQEAVIVDSRIPPSNDDTVAFVKQILAVSLKNHFVKGLILSGFDSDHSDVTGVSIILNKYRPDWVMYPKYFKDSEEANLVFGLIEEQGKLRQNTAHPLTRVSVRLDQLISRKLQGLSTNFDLELFSPHIEDMDCSNNCSIVLRVTGTGPEAFSYLITGDTENERWEAISRFFGGSLKSDIMAAAHHGSKNATHPASLLHIRPHTVLISAGVDNQYGHPDPQSLRVYAEVAEKVYSTNMQSGVSLMTSRKTDTFETRLIPN